MTPTTAETHTVASTENDVVAAVQQVLRSSSEPLTLSKIRAQLPSQFRQVSLEELAETLRRQVAANVLYQYPKYRSQQDRFWDRPMPVHVAVLLRETLNDGPLGLAELRRKLPAYAQSSTETVLNEQVAQNAVYRHPRQGSRASERFGIRPADPKEYLRPELVTLFGRLEHLGFTQTRLREGALELLHEEEWATPPASEAKRQGERETSTTGGAESATHPEGPDAVSQQ